MLVCALCSAIISQNQSCDRAGCPMVNADTKTELSPSHKDASAHTDVIVRKEEPQPVPAKLRNTVLTLIAILAVALFATLGLLHLMKPNKSPVVTVNVLADANVRSAPSSVGTKVLDTLSPGTQLTGRWVDGSDGSERWLEIDKNGVKGFVWSQNLGYGKPESSIASQVDTNTTSVSGEIWVCRDAEYYYVEISNGYYKFRPFNPDGGSPWGKMDYGNPEIYGDGTVKTPLIFANGGSLYGRWAYLQSPGKRKALIRYAIESSGDGNECVPPGQEPQYIFN